MAVFQARLFDEPQLASLCLENIDKNTSDAINAEGFTDIDLGESSTLQAQWGSQRWSVAWIILCTARVLAS